MKYLVKKGVNYVPREGQPEKRAEEGDVIDDWPKAELPWAVDDGILEPHDDDAHAHHAQTKAKSTRGRKTAGGEHSASR